MAKQQKLLNIDANAKTVKGQKKGYMTGILYLAPANLSGREVCAWRTPECSAFCLNTAGRGQFNTTQKSRIKKTKALFKDRAAFHAQLGKEIQALEKRAAKAGFKPCVRLNGTSDLDFTPVINAFPHIQFYDYTKGSNRMLQYLEGKLPKNYHLTFSLSETNMTNALLALEAGGNVAVVFPTKKGKDLPKKYMGYKVVDGDESDLRFLDTKRRKGVKGVIVGLRAKGKARSEGGTDSTFVREVA